MQNKCKNDNIEVSAIMSAKLVHTKNDNIEMLKVLPLYDSSANEIKWQGVLRNRKGCEVKPSALASPRILLQY